MKSKKILVFTIFVLAIMFAVLFSGCIREKPTATVGEKYDLTGDKNAEIVLKFNEDESFDSAGDNAKYLHNFWSEYLSKFDDAQSDTIWSLIESHKDELKGKDVSAVVVVWGYPDNFNMTLVTEEGNFNYVEKQKLPQPDGFTIMGVGSSFNIQSETCIGDSFQYFLASRLWYDNPSLREEVHPSYTIEEGSIVVCITIVAAVVSVVMTIKKGWDIGKVGKSILETRVHNFENMVKAAETGEIANVKKVDIWVDPFGTPHSIITDEEDNRWDEDGDLIKTDYYGEEEDLISGEMPEPVVSPKVDEEHQYSEYELEVMRVDDRICELYWVKPGEIYHNTSKDVDKHPERYDFTTLWSRRAEYHKQLSELYENAYSAEQKRSPPKGAENLHNNFLKVLQYHSFEHKELMVLAEACACCSGESWDLKNCRLRTKSAYNDEKVDTGSEIRAMKADAEYECVLKLGDEIKKVCPNGCVATFFS